MTRITGVIINIRGLANNTQSIMKEVIYMKKIYIKTSDIFAYKDEVKRMKYLDICYKDAEMRNKLNNIKEDF